MKAVIYTRVSSDEQIQGTSLETQRRICHEFCNRVGLEVVREFSDEGESAKTADRPQFQAMVKYCRPGTVDRVVIYRTDRFARSSYDWAVFRGLLAASGAAIVSATEPISDDPTGNFLQTVLAGIAQLDNEIRGERAVTAMQHLAQQGYWVHSAPLGYKCARAAGGNPVLVEDPEIAPLIRGAFAGIAERGAGSRATADQLQALGLKTRAGRRMTVKAIYDTLRNEVYCGRVRSKLTGDRSMPAKFPGLISVELFDRVQAILSGRSVEHKPHDRTREDLPLKSIVRCGCCGAPLTASVSRGRHASYAYYHCWRCGQVRVQAPVLETQYRELLEAVTAKSHGRMKLLRDITLRKWQKHREAAAAELACARANVNHLEKQLDRLLEKLLAGVIDDATYRTKGQEIRTDIALAKSAAHDREIGDLDVAGTLDYVEHILANALRIWEQLRATEKARFQELLFPGGLTYSKAQGLRTAISACILGVIPTCASSKSVMAHLKGLTSNRILAFLDRIDAYRRAAA